MKTLYLFSLLFIVTIISCNRNNNPVSTEIDPDKIPSNKYLGSFGTQTTYEQISKWFKPDTDIPFVQTPDSLQNLMCLPDSLLEEGVVEFVEVTYEVLPVDSSWIQNIIYPIDEYKRIDGKGIRYNILDEIEYMNDGNTYIPTYTGFSNGIWHESERKIISTTNFMKLDLPLTPEKRWIRKSRKDSTGSLINQYECRLIGKVNIQIKAGNFEAYKIEVISNWFNSIYDTIGYEYYVPYVGLVLEKTDREVSSITLTPEGNTEPIRYRKVFTKELVSYNFIN